MLNGRFLLAATLTGAGAAAVLYAVLADALGWGRDGFGLGQWALAILGAVLIVAGVQVTPSGRARLARFAAEDAVVSLGACVWLGIWFGLLTGLVEVVHQLIRKVAFGELIRQPVHLVWMAPLSFVVMFTPLALGLGLLRQVVPAITLRVVVFCLAVPAVWSQIILHSTIDESAGLVLSAGLAVYLARTAAAKAPQLHRLRRVTLPWLAGAIAVCGVVIPVWDSVAESRAHGDLPPPRAGAPNVLLIVLDTVRADHLGVYGYHRETTPRLAQLAESSVVFDWPFAPCSWTLPSHATFFTGRYPFEHRADWLVPLDDACPTLAEVLADRGYLTAGFAGNLAFCLREHGVARGFQRYEDFYVNANVTAFSTALGSYLTLGGRQRTGACVPCSGLRNDAPTITRRFLQWLDGIEGKGRPFFAFLNFFDAHLAYRPPPPYDTMFRGDGVHDDEKTQRLVDAYDGCIASIDEHIGEIVDRLSDRGLLDDTLVIVTGDHGELFGEHGLEGHANSLYRPLLHCAFIVRPPGGAERKRIPDVVSLRDLPATVLDVVGHGSDGAMPGHSLAAFWRGDGGDSPRIPKSPALGEVSAGINLDPSLPVSKGPIKSLTAGGMHFIQNADGTEELYALEGDPLHEENLIETPAGGIAAEKLRREIDRILRAPASGR